MNKIVVEPAPRKGGARRRGEPDVIGAAEAADIIGCRVPNLHQIAGLPQPYSKIAATTLWRRGDVEDFAARRNARLRR